MPPQEPLLEEPAVPQADRKQPDQADPPPPAVPETQAMPVNPGSQLAASSKNASERAEVTLPQLFERHPDLPPQATILGISDDGLPVVFDLADPSPGAVLVIGDERDEQLALLRTAVASLTARNTPRSVQILVISHQPQSWKSWIAERGLGRYLLDVLGGDDVAVREWVLRLADWTEQRRLGQRTGPAVLLVMDTLSFLSRLTYDVRLNFEWLVKEGPPAQIWPVAAVSTDLARSLGTRLVGVFQTRLLGFSRDPEAYLALASVPQEDIHSFRKTGQFSVQAGINWLRFRALHGL